MTLRVPVRPSFIWNDEIWNLLFVKNSNSFEEILKSYFDPVEKYYQMVEEFFNYNRKFKFCITNKNQLILDEFMIDSIDNPYLQINGVDATLLDSASMWLYKNINLPIPYDGIINIGKDLDYQVIHNTTIPTYKTVYELIFEIGQLTSYSQLKTRGTPSRILDTLKWLLGI